MGKRIKQEDIRLIIKNPEAIPIAQKRFTELAFEAFLQSEAGKKFFEDLKNSKEEDVHE